ncbi:GNAT family N-acetyltransferase [Glycomyces tritici]|uniref:GNAT family N-acetyltransferase n=1 Tax=Glycomyces tritici TaxID=2665176 RepID=A0ABT7YM58_9ACTN|nr:GNAT family N-acetyltransferase [Glycomyces tritici]MDN3239494.1 GNAT family N-acetyltransferase [Glycomyces tritici]
MDIPEEIEISLVRADEYQAVAMLRWQWETEGATKPTGDPEAFAKEFADWAQRNTETHRCIVLRRNGTVVGMAWLAVVARVPTPGSMSRAGGDLQSVYLAPEVRGRGLGEGLVAEALDEARRLNLKKVTVQSTTKSKNFYGRNGFIDAPKILQAKLEAKL